MGGSVGIPIDDYWWLSGGVGWDITAGAKVTSSGPLIYDPDTFTYKFTFKIKGPDGTAFGL